jgi:carboxyl-terminal processing protease
MMMYRLGARRSAGEGEYTASDKLAEAVGVIEDYYIGEYDAAELTDAAIEAMMEKLGDRWSYYMTAEELEAYTKASNNQYAGIGVVIREDAEGRISIATVYSKSPRARPAFSPGA